MYPDSRNRISTQQQRRSTVKRCWAQEGYQGAWQGLGTGWYALTRLAPFHSPESQTRFRADRDWQVQCALDCVHLTATDWDD